ncbi:MAG: anthranilate synthase component I family protein [Planctomycetes bacterium]|nr:anthranilate synthase component I family protein [Planctomycetota bacterium]
MQWQIQEVPWPRCSVTAAGLFAGADELAWLDSAVSEELDAPSARYSLLCTAPLAGVEQFEGREATFAVGGRVVARDSSGWKLWRSAVARLPRWPELPHGLAPGWVGYVAFEMARQLERLPQSRHEDLGLPWLRMGLYDRGITLDHHTRCAFAVFTEDVTSALDAGGPDHARLSNNAWLERWRAAAEAEPRPQTAVAGVLRCELEQREYEAMVTRALEYVAAGDIYQVNLAQRMWLENVGDPFAVYAALRHVNPAPYAALLNWPGGAIASVSPELFLRARGREVLTCPIKGTRPRTRDSLLDGIRRRDLLASEKDAAELAMIVDLHRNDLGRVCEYGSIRVAEPRRVETHPTVLHTAADIIGRLAPDRDALDLLTACFPAGSITGVPKIRACEIIDELEPAARGAYTGTVGALGLDGSLTCNVAIRTIQLRAGRAALYVGGGIVADSDPTDEYEETLAKGRGILEALHAARDGVGTAE